MLDMFDVMPFDNIDGGAWKQGWDVKYDDSEFDKEQLNVFVVPHSHNDPGKLMQFFLDSKPVIDIGMTFDMSFIRWT